MSTRPPKRILDCRKVLLEAGEKMSEVVIDFADLVLTNQQHHLDFPINPFYIVPGRNLSLFRSIHPLS